KSLRRRFGALAVRVAHTREKGVRLAFELIEGATCERRGIEPRARYADRHIEQERDVGLAILVDPPLEIMDARERHAMPTALIRISCVGESIAHHPIAASERRAYHELEVLAPRREHQQCLGFA